MAADIILKGEASGSAFGASLAIAGDAEGDGNDDVVVGALGYESARGRAYLYLSSNSGRTDSPDVILDGGRSRSGLAPSFKLPVHWRAAITTTTSSHQGLLGRLASIGFTSWRPEIAVRVDVRPVDLRGGGVVGSILEVVAVRAAHITDLHILAEPGKTIYGTDSFQSLKAVLDVALALPLPPDFFIATGDLTEDGSDSAYERLRGVLLDTGLTTYVVPGNHDSPSAMAASLLGGPIQMVPVVDIGGWRLLFLDSTLPGESSGFLAQTQLNLLFATITETPRTPVLVSLHHGPTRYCPALGCQLRNATDLVQMLALRHEARSVVVSGHGHVALDHSLGDVRYLVTPSSCSQARHPRFEDGGDPDDFWASHSFDPSRYAFRMLMMKSTGEFESEVHWIPARDRDQLLPS